MVAKGKSPPTNMAAQGTDEAALRKVFSKLVERLKAVDVIDELYENDILSNEEYEGILDASSQASSKQESKTVNRRVATDGHPPSSPGLCCKVGEDFEEKRQFFGRCAGEG